MTKKSPPPPPPPPARSVRGKFIVDKIAPSNPTPPPQNPPSSEKK